MNVLLISIAVASLGVDFGWKRLPDGGSEYIIQLDQQTLDALRDGQPIHSDVKSGAGEVRSFKIIVGNDLLAQEPPLEKPAPPMVVNQSPNPLLTDPNVKPIATNLPQPEKTSPADEPEPPTEPETVAKQAEKPWLALMLTVIGLFASLGTNVYLGWISWGLRRRRRAELAEQD